MEKGYYKPFVIPLIFIGGVSIHNKNGKGLLQTSVPNMTFLLLKSQSTIKMEKGYYIVDSLLLGFPFVVSIHNKNGKGLLLVNWVS